MDFTFTIHDGTNSRVVYQNEINEYMTEYGLDVIAKDRVSALFVINLMLLDLVSGIDPYLVINEIKALENIRPTMQTKAEAEFRGEHLKGLWHKHFLADLPSVIAKNILNQLGKNGLNNITREVLDPDISPVITKEMLNELTHKVVVESLEKRADQDKLTGEWIVYAKENNSNYYLGIWRHDAGDENIAKAIKDTCVPEFPFLTKYIS
jgi:hypothetical protein